MSRYAKGEEVLEDLYSSPKNSNKTNNKNNKSHGLDDKIHGDTMKNKIEEDMRVAIVNVNTFPWRRGKKEKLDNLRDLLLNSNADVVGMVETDTYWPKNSEEDRLYERTFGWWKGRSLTTSYNQTTCKVIHQQGGNAMIATGTMLGRKVGTGVDPRKIGRWSWMLFRGKGNVRVRIVTVYVPNWRYDVGALSTFTQQKQALQMNDISTCPIQQLKENLQIQVNEWLQNGDQVIVMGDFNEALKKPTKTGLISMLKVK